MFSGHSSLVHVADCVCVPVSRISSVLLCQTAEIDSMGGCALSQAAVTGLATSAVGWPSALIVWEAQHNPARMAGLVKVALSLFCPPLFLSRSLSHSLSLSVSVCVCVCVCALVRNDFLISQKKELSIENYFQFQG